MAAPATERAFGAPIEQRPAARTTIDPVDIQEAVESIMASITGDVSSVNLKLFSEIEALAVFINNAKAEIAALRPDDIKTEHLPNATDELEAIVGSTETATNSIFEAIEAIEEVAGELDGAQADKINAAVTSVYEACGFQDLTGQRITKVVNALKHIEIKVEGLLDAFGDDLKDVLPARHEDDRGLRIDGKQKRPDEELMNGPQLPSTANSQDDIDALLASFD